MPDADGTIPNGSGDQSPTSPGQGSDAGSGDGSPTSPGLTTAGGGGDVSPTSPGKSTAEGAGNDPVGNTLAPGMPNKGQGDVLLRARKVTGTMSPDATGTLKFVDGHPTDAWTTDGTSAPDVGYVLGFSSIQSGWILMGVFAGGFPTGVAWVAPGLESQDPSDLVFAPLGSETGTPVVSAEYTAPGRTTALGSGDQSPTAPGGVIP